jgi:cytoskeletal protein RodZ
MFCEKCGNKLEDGERFCSVCGAPVAREENPSSGQDIYREKRFDLDYESDATEGMGYGYQKTQSEENDYQQTGQFRSGDNFRQGGQFPKQPPKRSDTSSNRRRKHNADDDWEKEEKKEKVTFVILGIIIVVLVIAIIAGIVMLLKSGDSSKDENVPQLNEEMKAELEQSQKDDAQSIPSEEPTITITPEVTQEITPVPTQEVTPVPTQAATPIPTQIVTPVPTQAATPEVTQEPVIVEQSSDYIIPDSSTRYLSNADLNSLSEWQIRIARNEIYARHGRIFNSEELISYFAEKSWYSPSISPEKFDNSYLNAIEIENLKFIANYEKAHNLNQ